MARPGNDSCRHGVPGDAMENRLIELETRIAFQEHTVQELNSVVARQQQELLRLRHEIENLRAQLQALAASPVAGRSEETPPPHY
jgi:SlyX protein